LVEPGNHHRFLSIGNTEIPVALSSVPLLS
jgi:hypothetical protein